jgi:hypothetical protein
VREQLPLAEYPEYGALDSIAASINRSGFASFVFVLTVYRSILACSNKQRSSVAVGTSQRGQKEKWQVIHTLVMLRICLEVWS